MNEKQKSRRLGQTEVELRKSATFKQENANKGNEVSLDLAREEHHILETSGIDS